MLKRITDDKALLARLNAHLMAECYSKSVCRIYCKSAQHFLRHLRRRRLSILEVQPSDIKNYLLCALRRFCQRHGRSPSSADDWRSRHASGIHVLLRLVLGQWPPISRSPCQAVCNDYRQWLEEKRHLASETVFGALGEARRFLSWHVEYAGTASLADLAIIDIDAYLRARCVTAIRRPSRKCIAFYVRDFLRFLHVTGRTSRNLSTGVIAPTLYAFESIPSALCPEEIGAVLEVTRQDRSPLGLRDYAILMLLSTYGLRAGEIIHLRLEDIDWRNDRLRIRHTKTGGQSDLPLLPAVGAALLDYLRRGRPQTAEREVFIRACAPYRAFVNGSSLYPNVRSRIEAAGVQPVGKRGPHAFRHARLLRAGVPLKVIGDLLGHRSAASTTPYLKLATAELRGVSLEVPCSEEQS